MRTHLRTALGLVLLCGLASSAIASAPQTCDNPDCAADSAKGVVVDLTTHASMASVKAAYKDKILLVKFYAPWCGHCKRMQNDWVALAKELESDAAVVVAEVDCDSTLGKPMCKEADVAGYPTVKSFMDGEDAGEHTGSRDVAGFTRWLDTLKDDNADDNDHDDEDDTPSLAATHTPGEVLVLTKATFKGTTAQSKTILVKFFAPWCGHCKKMAEAWVELAKEYKDNSNIIIAEVDCTETGDVCESAGVSSYPTVKAFRSGVELGEHTGGRDLATLSAWAQTSGSMDLPSADHSDVVKLSASNFVSTIGSDKVTLVKFFAPWCGHCKNMASAWEQLAREYKGSNDVVVAEVDCDKHEEVCQEAGVEGFPTIKAFKGGKDLGEHQGGRDAATLKSFAESHVSEDDAGDEARDTHALTAANFKSVVGTSKVTLVKFFAPWCGHCKNMAPAWEELAKEYKDSTEIAIAEVDCTQNQGVCKDAKIDGYPTIKAFKDGEDMGEHAGSRTSAGFKTWIKKLTSPKADGPEAPSAPAQHTPGEVLTLGGADFKGTTGTDKLVLVKFFAPWCGHCKKMAEAWVELAKEYKDNSNIIIAEVDCTQHQETCQGAGASGYPTIKGFKGGKDLGKHSGARDVPTFKTWAEGLTKPKEPEAPSVAATHTPGEVLALGKADFKGTTGTDKLVLVKFFAPWCGHCKKMAEAWVELAKEYKDNSNIIIAEVDCTQHQETCQGAGASGYPTIKGFKGGKDLGKHSGARDVPTFKTWAEGLTKPKEPEAPSVAATHTPGEVLALGKADFKGTTGTDKLVLVKFFAPWCGHCKKMAEAWVELAKEYKDNSNIIIAEVDCTQHQETCQGAGASGYPTIKGFKGGKELGRHSGARDVPTFKTWAEGLTKPKEPEAPSVAATHTPGEVLALGKADFKGTTGTDKLVLVKFFAPWCGHCKKMAEAWVELAKEYKDKSNIIIAEVDCTQHKETCQGAEVDGFPTIKAFKGGKDLGEHQGGRDLASLKGFATTSAT